MKTKRIGSNPLDALALVNAPTEVRRARRELTADGFRAPFRATQESGRAFRGLTGEVRFHPYRTAAATGSRANALANLTPADFDRGADTPMVTLPARSNESRKPKAQPLPSEAVGQLRPYPAGKPGGRVVWPAVGFRARRK